MRKYKLRKVCLCEFWILQNTYREYRNYRGRSSGIVMKILNKSNIVKIKSLLSILSTAAGPMNAAVNS